MLHSYCKIWWSLLRTCAKLVLPKDLVVFVEDKVRSLKRKSRCEPQNPGGVTVLNQVRNTGHSDVKQ
jgi:hypothetical protein